MSRSRIALIALACLAAASCLVAKQAYAQQRRAFLAITSTYDHLRGSSLRIDELRAIGGALRQNGFDVVDASDERSAVIRAKFARFIRRVTDEDFVVFILAGHMLSSSSGALYLPRETQVRNTTDVFRRAIPLRTFASAAARGRHGLVLMIATNPEVSSQFNQLVPFPNNIAQPPANVGMAFSSSRSMPVSQIDYEAGNAVKRLIRLIVGDFDDGRDLAAAVAGPGTGTMLGLSGRMPLPESANVGAAGQGIASPITEAQPDTETTSSYIDERGRPAGRTRLYREDALTDQQAEVIAKLQKDYIAERKAREEAEERARQAENRASAASQRLLAAQRTIELQKREDAKRSSELVKLETSRQQLRRAREAAEERAAAAREEAAAAETAARAAEQQAKKALEAKLAAEAEVKREQAAASKRAAALSERAAEAEQRRRAAEQELSDAREQAARLSKDHSDRAAAKEASQSAEAKVREAAERAQEADERAQAAEAEAKANLAARLAAEQAVRAQRIENAKLADELARIKKVAAETRLKAEQRLAETLELGEKLALLEADRAAEASAREAAQQQAADAAAMTKTVEARARAAEERLATVIQDKAATEKKVRELKADEQQRHSDMEKAAKIAQRRLQETEAELDRLKKRAQRLAVLEDEVKQESQARKSAENSIERAAEQVRNAEQRAREAEAFAELAAERLRVAESEKAQAHILAEQSGKRTTEQIREAERRTREAEAFAQRAAERLHVAQSEAAYNERQLREEIETLRKKIAGMEQQPEVGRQGLSTQTVPLRSASSVNATAVDGPRGTSQLRAKFTTDDLTAAQIETVMSGVKIKGNRRIDGEPFTLVINPDKTVHYEFRQRDAFPDGIRRVVGSWRAEDSRFCFNVRSFHFGREACPRMIKDGDKMWLERRNGERLPWRVSLPVAD